jgi:hypothetical protein
VKLDDEDEFFPANPVLYAEMYSNVAMLIAY